MMRFGGLKVRAGQVPKDALRPCRGRAQLQTVRIISNPWRVASVRGGYGQGGGGEDISRGLAEAPFRIQPVCPALPGTELAAFHDIPESQPSPLQITASVEAQPGRFEVRIDVRHSLRRASQLPQLLTAARRSAWLVVALACGTEASVGGAEDRSRTRARFHPFPSRSASHLKRPPVD